MNKQGYYHFIGIGGIGMSGLAQLLLHDGKKVSGSDLKETKIIQFLRDFGAEVFIGHQATNVKDASMVIYSSAISQDNPEVLEAKRRNIPLLLRAAALAKLMEDKTVITVTGSHGKTTTTSLVSYLLLEAGLTPTVAIGGILRNIDTNACLGKGDYFVAEADESDGSFLYYRPRYSIITNIDREHLDYYKEFKNELDAFSKFLNRTESNGCVFCCSDDVNLKRILADYKKKYILFGLNADANIYPKNIEMNGLSSEFDCFYNDKFVERFHLALGGRHNISNALSAIALGMELGIDLETIKKALRHYKGAKRRLENKFTNENYIVIDDYAHHPTEIKATLLAIKNLNPNRVIAVFQPHRYSRTKLLLNEFSLSFDLADSVIVTDIYPAGEMSIEGITGECISDKIKENTPGKDVIFLPKEKLIPHLLNFMRPKDLIITLGAGDIVKTCDELVDALKNRH